jgi:dienelactone hydrolase
VRHSDPIPVESHCGQLRGRSVISGHDIAPCLTYSRPGRPDQPVLLVTDMFGITPFYRGFAERLANDCHGPIFGVWGRADQAVGIPVVEKFAAELEDRKIEADITLYPDVGHGFMAGLGAGGSPGDVHAANAWQRLLSFYDSHVAPSR